MKRFNQIFGYKYPYYSRHALNRYAERFYNVKKENCNSWVKYNFKKIIKELYTKLCLGEIINTEDDFTSYLEKKIWE